MDFVQKGRSLLHLVYDHQPPVMPVAFSQQGRAGDVVRKNIGFQQIDYLGADQVVGNPVGFSHFARPPKKSGFSGGQVKLK